MSFWPGIRAGDARGISGGAMSWSWGWIACYLDVQGYQGADRSEE